MCTYISNNSRSFKSLSVDGGHTHRYRIRHSFGVQILVYPLIKISHRHCNYNVMCVYILCIVLVITQELQWNVCVILDITHVLQCTVCINLHIPKLLQFLSILNIVTRGKCGAHIKLRRQWQNLCLLLAWCFISQVTY